MPSKLTVKQERFAQEYISMGNASAAYRKVYDASKMTDEAIHVSASRVKAKVWLRIQELQKFEAEKYAMTRSEVLKIWAQIATADVNEIVQIRRKSCAHCYEGDFKLVPSVTCQKCGGDGEAYMYITDTRQLTGAARLLYAGAKRTRDGIEVMLRDQDSALVNIARAIAIFDEVKHKPALNLQAVSDSIKSIVDPKEASRVYQSIMQL